MNPRFSPIRRLQRHLLEEARTPRFGAGGVPALVESVSSLDNVGFILKVLGTSTNAEQVTSHD